MAGQGCVLSCWWRALYVWVHCYFWRGTSVSHVPAAATTLLPLWVAPFCCHSCFVLRVLSHVILDLAPVLFWLMLFCFLFGFSHHLVVEIEKSEIYSLRALLAKSFFFALSCVTHPWLLLLTSIGRTSYLNGPFGCLHRAVALSPLYCLPKKSRYIERVGSRVQCPKLSHLNAYT